VGVEDNEMLMAEVSKEELKGILHSFQKYKSLGPNGWTIEFFLVFLELIGDDHIQVVEESRLSGHIHPPINATFIALIPKTDHPTSFEHFLPISLCNCLYKIISKIISHRFNDILSRSISGEQFGFLNGRQIHEAIGVA
jgi:hypothetical protein